MIRFVVVLLVGFGLLAVSLDLTSLAQWTAQHQRTFQNQMATAVRALQAGQPGAVLTLLAMAAGYGFVHALGPGHGKYLIGGVGMGTQVSAPRLLSVAMVSSLAQAIWAIVLVYGGFAVLEATARQMTHLAEAYLAPLSYAAIGGVGVYLVWRGARALWSSRDRFQTHAHSHEDRDHDGCCHAHGPAPEDVARLKSMREAALLVFSIAMRPCTGALFLLVIAWQMDIRLAGAAAVLAMGLGTALLTSAVAVSSIAARGAALAVTGGGTVLPVALSGLQILAGVAIVLISAAMVRAAL